MLVTILVVFLFTIISVLSYACWNMLKKNEELEDVITAFYGRTNATIRLMRVLDQKQMFENDDEVGTVFKQLVECVDSLDAYVMEIRDGNTTKEEER